MGESAPATPGRGSPAPADATHHPPPTVYTPLVGRAGSGDVDEDDMATASTEDLAGVHRPPVAPEVAVSATTLVGGPMTDSDSDSDIDYTPRRPRVRHPAGGYHRKYVPVPTITGPEVSPGVPLDAAAAARLAAPSVVPGRYPVGGFLETPGPLPILLTPLPGMGGSKSDLCSYIMPPSTGGCCSLDNKSDTNSVYTPLCRICHMGEEDEPLISPCRCSGTLQHIHNTCLMRWLEILSKKSRKPPKCELCHFQYHRHKKFKFHHWRFPRVSRQDKILHIIFVVNLVMMIGCAVATVMSFLSDEGSLNHGPPGNNVELSTEEIITLSCGVLFFVSFFIAMSVQIKAKHTIYQLLVKFIMHNMEWEIDEYDKSKDSLYKDLYKGLPVYV